MIIFVMMMCIYGMKRSRAIADFLFSYCAMPRDREAMPFSSMAINVCLVYHGARKCAILDQFSEAFTPADSGFMNAVLNMRCFEMMIYQNDNEWLIWRRGNEALTRDLQRDDADIGKHLGYFCGGQARWKNARRRFFVHVSEQTTGTPIFSQACVVGLTDTKALQRCLVRQCTLMETVLKMYASWCRVEFRRSAAHAI